MLKKLKKIIDAKGMTFVANKMGYRSHATIAHWFKNNKIPKIATMRVEKFLKEV